MRYFAYVSVLSALAANAAQLAFGPGGQNLNLNSERPIPVLRTSLRERSFKAEDSGYSMADVAGGEFFKLQVDEFPNHSIRIKETSGWCDPTVKSYSGYLDVGFQKNIFFYFFESRSSPADDPVLMWINGGPGCSSAIGLFMELGPCSVDTSASVLEFNSTKFNPHSWNSKANLLFLDEPINVGFSLSKNGQKVGTTEDAAIDIQRFLAIFFETFKEWKGRSLTISGESYGGRYIPVFASAIYDGNAALVAAGGTAINLTSVAIGNGITDAFSMVEGYIQHTCTNLSGTPPIASVSDCVYMNELLPRCKKAMKKSCIDTMDVLGCDAAMAMCDPIQEIFFKTGRNPYDTSVMCEGEIAETLCYPITKVISNYLDLPAVRQHLGVDKSIGNFASCSGSVGSLFVQARDSYGHTWRYVSALLERDIDVLIYIGKFDWICNFLGNRYWTEALEWTGKTAFNAAKEREWTVDGKAAGETKSASSPTAGTLTYLTINAAGHMVPYDKPAEALQMINRFLKMAEF